MAKNKFFEMLKKNWIGGIIGIVLLFVVALNNWFVDIHSINFLFNPYIGYPLSYIVGAFVQSKGK